MRCVRGSGEGQEHRFSVALSVEASPVQRGPTRHDKSTLNAAPNVQALSASVWLAGIPKYQP